MKNPRITTGLLTLLAVLSVAVMLLALYTDPRPAAFTPPPFDPGAVTGIPDPPEGSGYQNLDTTVFRAALCGAVVLQEGNAEIWFTNPVENTLWMRLRVLDEGGNTLGQTGLLRPGEYVQSVALNRVLPPGTPIVLKLMAYEPDTYHAAGTVTVNTAIYAP